MAEITTNVGALIPISEKNGKKAVNARDLHAFLESKQDFSTWIKNRIEKYDLVENIDYVLLHNFMEQVSGTKHRINQTKICDCEKTLYLCGALHIGRRRSPQIHVGYFYARS